MYVAGGNKVSLPGLLQQRDALLRRLRDFFFERGFIEVETPLAADEVIPELHIEPFQLADGSLLQASPELCMKRLLAEGAEAIFQITRSFRRGESGRWHSPEFTIVEWYRTDHDMARGMDLLDELAQATLGTRPARRTSYAAAFQEYVGLDPHMATIDKLAAAAAKFDEAVPSDMRRADRDEWLNLLLATQVEPHLGREGPEILFHYPAAQAALATIMPTQHGYEVAERFELYWRGVELANGYHELTDAVELGRRFEEVIAARVAAGRARLPMPERWLADITGRLPDSTGVALGFDRLVMLATGAESIDEVLDLQPAKDE
jgi:elongation factor P--(R)-beta-lysine ligase